MRNFLILITVLLAAASEAQTTVRVVRLGQNSEVAPVFHVWGGQDIELALEVKANEATHKASVRASVYQLAGAIAAPATLNVPVAEKLSFDRSLALAENWKWSVPAVRHPTSFELRFSAQSDDGGEWKPAGSARLVAYPGDLGAQLKEMAVAARTNGTGRIAVFGASADLKTALRAVAIPFDEMGETLPDELESSVVYLGQGRPTEIDAMASRVRSRSRVIFFSNDPSQLPGVYRTDSGGGSITKVTLPLLLDFANSPQKQAALLSLLQSAFQISKTAP